MCIYVFIGPIIPLHSHSSPTAGDFARTYFYLSTFYMNIWECCDDVGVNGSSIKPWMEAELRQWHKLDPVDKYEVARNNMIYSDYQHNRNPFIDYPELVDQIDDF